MRKKKRSVERCEIDVWHMSHKPLHRGALSGRSVGKRARDLRSVASCALKYAFGVEIKQACVEGCSERERNRSAWGEKREESHRRSVRGALRRGLEVAEHEPCRRHEADARVHEVHREFLAHVEDCERRKHGHRDDLLHHLELRK